MAAMASQSLMNLVDAAMVGSLGGEALAACKGVLKELKKHKDCGVFLEPVDWKALDLPLYPKLIKKPIPAEGEDSNISDEDDIFAGSRMKKRSLRQVGIGRFSYYFFNVGYRTHQRVKPRNR